LNDLKVFKTIITCISLRGENYIFSTQCLFFYMRYTLFLLFSISMPILTLCMGVDVSFISLFKVKKKTRRRKSINVKIIKKKKRNAKMTKRKESEN